MSEYLKRGALLIYTFLQRTVFDGHPDDALQRFLASKGWSGGVDASVAVMTVGANGALDANASQAPTSAFIMTNAGLMAGATLQGTKITRIAD